MHKLYEFDCPQCGIVFEALQYLNIDTREEEAIFCPDCETEAIKRTAVCAKTIWSNDPIKLNAMLAKRSEDHSRKEWDKHGPSDKARELMGLDQYSKPRPGNSFFKMKG